MGRPPSCVMSSCGRALLPLPWWNVSGGESMRAWACAGARETTGKKRKQALHSLKNVTFAWRALGENIYKGSTFPCILFFCPREKAKARTLTRSPPNFEPENFEGAPGDAIFRARTRSQSQVNAHDKHGQKRKNMELEERTGRSREKKTSAGPPCLAANSDAKLCSGVKHTRVTLDRNTVHPHMSC